MTANILHASDCAVNNAPALPPGPCDCGAEQAAAELEIVTLKAKVASLESSLAEARKGAALMAEWITADSQQHGGVVHDNGCEICVAIKRAQHPTAPQETAEPDDAPSWLRRETLQRRATDRLVMAQIKDATAEKEGE